MADFFKSAANYFSSSNIPGSVSSSSNGAPENPLIGTVVTVNSMQLRIKRQIGEGLSFTNFIHFSSSSPISAGGYAFVFIAQDLQSGTDYALKVFQISITIAIPESTFPFHYRGLLQLIRTQ